jgi:hypothetical protein
MIEISSQAFFIFFWSSVMVIGGQYIAMTWWKEQSVQVTETEILPRLATMIKEQTPIDALICIIFSLLSEIIEFQWTE